MKTSFTKYPIDLIICMLGSIILLPITFLDIDETIRLIIGLPFLLFIPGYILIFALFPTKKTDKGIDILERIALSFGLSLAIVTLIGLALNYTPQGIRLEPILLSIIFFIMSVGSIGVYRWIKTTLDERFTISINILLPQSEHTLDKALLLLLITSIIIATASFIYIGITPPTAEKFTEFYLLGSEGTAEKYLRNISVGENATVIVGIANHEYRTINYTVEVWLINQTTQYNETTNTNETLYHHMWFMDKLLVMLPHVEINLDDPWKPQWQFNYTFNLSKQGTFELAFLLYNSSTENYSNASDYKDIAEEKIKDAYREIHLWINVY
jgi:uncharacterized membrane protein